MKIDSVVEYLQTNPSWVGKLSPEDYEELEHRGFTVRVVRGEKADEQGECRCQVSK